MNKIRIGKLIKTPLLCITLILFLLLPVFVSAQIASGPKFLGNVIAGDIPDNWTTYWNQVTSENAGKWGSVESSQDNMNWNNLDLAYDFAKSNGFPYKHHTLVWGSQEPGWIGGLSQSEQLVEITEWIQAVGERYPDCDFIDVVNEPLHAPASYRAALGGDGATGWDWVIKSFELARQYCNGKLLLNDYGIVNDEVQTGNYLEIINLLNDRGLIDGIGVQAHAFNLDDYAASLITRNLDRLAATGLPIYPSEVDLRGDDATQLQRYQEKFAALWDHPGVKGITLWGYIQGTIWQSEAWLVSSGSIGATERPAMQWLKEYVGASSVTLAPGETPTPTPSPTPEPTPTPTEVPVDCSGAAEWSAGAIYDSPGTRVIYNGVLYENNWYTAGDNPEENSGDYEVWTRIGSCGATGETPSPTAVVTTAPTNPPNVTPNPGTLGDTNSDGVIDIVDALLIAQYYVDLNPVNFNPDAADTNCDGNIDIVDALLVAQYYVSLITEFC
ncbi:MAG: endo-1,4-beta-xylanase [Spirochaetales bacterium]|nr:endo-1,4-beta-xylanase [Spirochaetales bacterium]